MTTRINIFNEGPKDITVYDQQEGVVDFGTVLAPSQGLEIYIWKDGKQILIKENE